MAGAVRQPIDIPSLERYLDQNLPIIKTPIEVKQFGFGQSNPTYLITGSDKQQYVLRKKPPGKLLSKTAHQVEREYKIIHALEKTDVPVPKAYCLCEDSNVIGTPFYIMEFLDGRMFTDPAIPGVSAEERTALWRDAVRTLAKFHRVVPKSVGLERFGKPSGYYDRQIATFTAVSNAQAQAVDIETKKPVGELPHFLDMVRFFSNKATQPLDRGTLVHGDYKIDNMVFHKTEPRVIGILDWEMATVGHPLSDFCNLTSPYFLGGTEHKTEQFQPGVVPGLPRREDCVRWYREVAGWDPTPDILWGDAFFSWRSSVIMQGIAARYALRQASSARAQEYAQMTGPFALGAWERVKKVQEQVRQKGKL
ncbi:acyl-CoA dehydrogenase family member 11 [Aspergillus udagawae]|uniref:Acyl-CoA dehydrogenase family member 11 n=1 Tax=Aspergillus udagawae TaxID=91492 RepID=A0ABQ1AIF6_9EURO|nr:acyl-CoA dehydrogenase family member 11 [Aspergillus udagawae]GFF82498.1 acyl-CoA dehydrogenase family member 11 [Aspergillus udagawae]GFG03702.1 acyl-CoA dehydrogenase family member 11 [Aspergillus udagawae]GFG24660.1 acyl-CoA dehydrogenase family member 11 [Aspergillus udagawae]